MASTPARFGAYTRPTAASRPKKPNLATSPSKPSPTTTSQGKFEALGKSTARPRLPGFRDEPARRPLPLAHLTSSAALDEEMCLLIEKSAVLTPCGMSSRPPIGACTAWLSGKPRPRRICCHKSTARRRRVGPLKAWEGTSLPLLASGGFATEVAKLALRSLERLARHHFLNVLEAPQ